MTDRVAQLAKWLLAAVFFTLPLNALRFHGVAIADILLVLLLPLIPFALVVRRRELKFPRWLWIGGLILAISVALVAVLPPGPLDELDLEYTIGTFSEPYASSAVIGARLVFALVVFPVMVSLLIDRWTTFGFLVSAWLIGVSISCAAAILDAAFGLGIQSALSYNADEIRGYFVVHPGDIARQVGLTDHPNTLCLTAMMALPVVLAKMMNRRGLLLFSPLLILIIGGILVTGTRIGLVGIALALVLTVAFNLARIRSGLVAGATAVRERGGRTLSSGWRGVARMVIVLALFMTLLFSVAYVSTSADSFSDLEPASVNRLVNTSDSQVQVSNTSRGDLIRDSVDAIAERPVTGYGFRWVEAPHSILLALLVSGGIIALFGFVLVMFGYVREGLRLRNAVPENLRDLCTGLTISVIVFLITDLAGNQSFNRYIYIPAALILGMYLLARAGKPMGSVSGQDDSVKDS